MARFTNYGSRRKEPSERASRPDRECDRLGGRGPIHEGHAALGDVRELEAGPRGAPPSRGTGDRRRRAARPRIRQELSAVSSWPTIPQVFVRGELVGGADIVEELAQSGELERTLEDRLGPDYRGAGAERVVSVA